ncbi:hypothetical protein IWX92DRAFT_370363 [Phyllosticta citricarpa]
MVALSMGSGVMDSILLAPLVSSAVIGFKHGLVHSTCLASWVSLWSLRFFLDDPAATRDLRTFATFLGFMVVRDLFPNLSILAVLLIVSVAAAGYLLRPMGASHPDKDLKEIFHHCTPLLIPSRTTHSRMFPQKHSFAYSYLLVGIPIGPAGRPCRYGSLISVDTDLLPAGQNRRGWFHVQGSDYLERWGQNMTLKDKLAQYLRSQGVDDESWHHAYLVTAPKFLGYHFNPVSFWYIYSEQNQLQLMVLEVNNTFDERRMYLLKADGDISGKQNSNTVKFVETWTKDFHVSPFNSRKGSYALTARDPFYGDPGMASIDNNIVLRSSEGHAKLVARIFSEKSPTDPRTATTFDSLCFISKWWWVGFVTFPRILREAFKLYFWKKLDVFFRPEVLPTSVGRKPIAEEIALEHFFRRYLRDLAKQSPLRVSYSPPPGMGTPEVSTSSKLPASACEDIEIRVLTPAFYSRFVHYSHSSEAFDRECIFTEERNRTVWISRPELLPDLPLGKLETPSDSKGKVRNGRLGWTVVKRLRCPPAAPSYPNKDESIESHTHEDIRVQKFSPLDEYVYEYCSDSHIYRRCLIKLFLAQRYFAGFTEVLDFVDTALRLGLAYLSFDTVRSVGNVFHPSGLLYVAWSVFMVNVLHFWGIAKELSYRF